MTPRIAVVGAGANGASIGADLHNAGHDVTLIEQWPQHVEAIRANGLRVNTLTQSRTTCLNIMHICEVATLRHKFDVVLMLMKAYDSRWAAQLVEPYLEDHGLLVGVQNGMTVDVITEVVGPARAMGCVIEITSMMFDPGIVERHSGWDRSWFAVGNLSDATLGREHEIAHLLACSGIVETVNNIRAAKWMKLVSNATTLVTTGILGLPMVEAAAIPHMRALMLRSGQEALDAAVRLGNPILPIFGLTAVDVSTPHTVVETLLNTLLGRFVLPDSKTTVLQDWLKSRRSEVDNINGLVASTHQALDGRAPTNEAVVEVAHRIEQGILQPSPRNLDLLLALERNGIAGEA